MELTAFADLLQQQCGVVARRQLLAGGAGDPDIKRWVRRNELRRVHTGVYVDHTGPLTWANRAWAAVLFHWPAALTGPSCLDRTGDVVHVAVDATRTPSRLPGVRTQQVRGLERRVQWNLSPPRVRVEDAVLTMCGRCGDRVDALEVLLDVCRRRLTTPARLAAELDGRQVLRHRRWLVQVLQEAADGVQSVLESSYRRRVERAHGLPRPDRQWRERTAEGLVYRDARYDAFQLVVELDGRIGHEPGKERWDDQDRDLLVAAEDVMTLRLGWRHCETTPCRTAGRLATVLRKRGWRGAPRPCGPQCSVLRHFAAG